MDLGISGKKALVCASSEGLGKACAVSLSREGVHVYINGRTLETLEATAAEIRAEGGEVTIVQADVSTEEGRKALIDACPDPDILINNNAGPNPVGFAQSSQKDWDEAIAANMMAPIFMHYQHYLGYGEIAISHYVCIQCRACRGNRTGKSRVERSCDG
jgi:3-oxoacyl-[acyl-carrier protein] reductase